MYGQRLRGSIPILQLNIKQMSYQLTQRQRIAWMVLLGGVFVCAGIAIATPLLISRTIQTATRALLIEASANQGTLGIFHPETGTRALFMGEPTDNLETGSRVLTNASDTAVLVFYSPNHARILAWLRLYGNSNLTIEQATTPRFVSSDQTNKLQMLLLSGRIRVSVPAQAERPLGIQISTPHGNVSIHEAGEYSLEVNNANTELSVQEGQAELIANNQTLIVRANTRGVMATGQPTQGPLPAERNLLSNANFFRNLSDWVALEWNVELADQPTGEMTVLNRIGEPALTFVRAGSGHTDVGVRQIIEKDVTDFSSLRLLIGMRIVYQSLGVCGTRGSECPLTVQIEYEDVNGTVRQWQQGFYAVGTFSVSTPDVCVSCPPPRNTHDLVTLGQINFYESENLLEKLRQQDIEVRRLRSITLIAAGHSFEVEVLDVTLMAKE